MSKPKPESDITWNDAAVERGGFTAKDLLVLARTEPPVRPAVRLRAQDGANGESDEAAIKRYLEMYEKSKPRPRGLGLDQGPSGGEA
jgi:hypothetical protein